MYVGLLINHGLLMQCRLRTFSNSQSSRVSTSLAHRPVTVERAGESAIHALTAVSLYSARRICLRGMTAQARSPNLIPNCYVIRVVYSRVAFKDHPGSLLECVVGFSAFENLTTGPNALRERRAE